MSDASLSWLSHNGDHSVVSGLSEFHENTILPGEEEILDPEFRRSHLSFDGHDRPFPTWYPYAFVGAIAAVGAAFYVLG